MDQEIINKFKVFIHRQKKEFDEVSDDNYDALKDLEWIQYKIDLELCSICQALGLKVNNFPPENYQELEDDGVIDNEHWEFYLSMCKLQNELIADLSFYHFQLFWPHLEMTKDEMLIIIEANYADDPNHKIVW
jgi:uncharacterized protein YutE (UPF0331/DUF86 family)